MPPLNLEVNGGDKLCTWTTLGPSSKVSSAKFKFGLLKSAKFDKLPIDNHRVDLDCQEKVQ